MFVCCTVMILYRVHTMPADDSILRYIGHNGFLMSQTEQASGIASRIDTHRTHTFETVCESQKFTGIMTCGLLWLKDMPEHMSEDRIEHVIASCEGYIQCASCLRAGTRLLVG